MNVCLHDAAFVVSKPVCPGGELKRRGLADFGEEVVVGLERLEPVDPHLPLIKQQQADIRNLSFWGNPVRAHYLYFPFWDWYVVGYINEKDYQAPLAMARRVIYTGTFGLLAAIWLVLLVVVNNLISSPLR